MQKELWLERLTSPETEQALKDGYKTVVVMCGSIEQHGPHLPLSTDATLGYAIGDVLVKKLDKALLAPVVRPGLSEHHMAFKGSLTLSKATFQAVVSDIVHSLARHGFERIIMTFSHGGNASALAELAPYLAAELPDVAIMEVNDCINAYTSALKEIASKDGITEAIRGMHAGECETSLFLTFDENQVRKDKLTEGFTGEFNDELGELLNQGLHHVTKNGILGDATYADKARGEKYLNAIAEYMANNLVRVEPKK